MSACDVWLRQVLVLSCRELLLSSRQVRDPAGILLIVLEIMELTQGVVSIVWSKLWRRKASAEGTCEGAGCSDEEAT